MSHLSSDVDANRNSAREWRIVLVGQSGLDRPLRREGDLELVRVRNGLEAIGELARPIDAHSPRRAAVLITPSAVDAQDLERLASALRAVDPKVRVLGVGEPSSSWHRTGIEGGAIDGTVAADADAPQVREALHAARPRRTPAPEAVEPSPREPDAPETPEAPRPMASSPRPAETASRAPAQPPLQDHDERILGSMLRSGPAGPVCMAILRERHGDDTFHWRPHDTEAAPRPGYRVVPVRYRDAELGELDVRDDIPEASASAAASWLAHWLALDEQQRQLREAAFVDPLTGAWNRRYFEQHLDTVVARAAEARLDVTVLLLDVHDLKHFNDRFGHAAGDEVLKATVQLLLSCVRGNDRVCRVGGDEFAVVFWEPSGPRSPGSRTPRSVTDLARRFQEKLATADFAALGPGAPGRLAVAGGMATFPWDGHDRTSLLAHADALLRESKRSGRNAILIGSAGGGEPEGF